MGKTIASKIAAVAIAVVMNGIVLGGVCYLFDLHAYAAPTSAHCESNATRVLEAIA